MVNKTYSKTTTFERSSELMLIVTTVLVICDLTDVFVPSWADWQCPVLRSSKARTGTTTEQPMDYTKLKREPLRKQVVYFVHTTFSCGISTP